jgi:hypothetical protein
LHGYNTMLTVFPHYNLGIFIAMTGEDKDDLFRTTLSSYITDKYVGKESWVNSTVMCTFPAPFLPALTENPPKTHPEVALGGPHEDFTGNYTNNIYGRAEITYENGNLALNYGYAKFILKRELSNAFKFNMFPTGIIEHMFSVDDVRFKKDKTASFMESFRVDKFDNAVFERVPPPTTTTTTTTTAAPPPPPPPPAAEKPAGGIAIPIP